MKAPKNSSLYNQDTLQDDDFVAQFVARHEILDALLRRLRAVKPDQMGQHQILIGPRGMGKTSLLRRLAIEINTQSDLKARYIPLRFREEQYNVLRLGDFWRNCGESLAEWAEASGQAALANRLDAALPGPDWAGDDSSAERFEAELTALGRRAVLLVDNLDLIIDALPDKDRWSLRKCLQRRSGPVTIGAATQLLKDSADRDAAFYEFFQPHHLEPLDENETKKCMFALAQRRGELGKPVLAVLAHQPERLKTLHTLTGGNPRILALIYRLLESAESDAAMADLEILLDQVTPYYKARIEEYQTPQQRAVIDAIGLHWDPITTGDLSHITNIPSTTLSPLLIKLKREGLIENVETSSSYAGHQFVERFLNIWYLMRRGTRRAKQKMRWLVAFLSSYYSPLELSEIANNFQANKRFKSWHPEYEFALIEALRKTSVSENANSNFFKKLDELNINYFQIKNIDSSNHKRLPYGLRNIKAIKLFLKLAKELRHNIIIIEKNGYSSEAIAVLDNFVARFASAQDPDIRQLIASLLFFKGLTLGMTGDHTAAIAAYDDVIACFADAQEPALKEQVARALVIKGVTLHQTGDQAAAIAVYDDFIARFADAQEPALRENIAHALYNKGIALGQTGNHAAAIAVYDDVLARFSEAQEPALRERVARALFKKGSALGQTSDHDAEIAVNDDIIARFADAQEPALRELVARALLKKGLTISQTGDHAAAVAVYDDMVVRFAHAQEPTVRAWVAEALINKGLTLAETGDLAAAVTVNDDIVTRFADAQEPALREIVAEALVYKGLSLGRTGDHPAAIAVYDEIVARFADAQQPALREKVTETRIRLANLVLDLEGDVIRAEGLYKDAREQNPLMANANLAWLYLAQDKLSETGEIRKLITALPETGLALIDAGIQLGRRNFGSAMDYLTTALDGRITSDTFIFEDDLGRFMRLAKRKGYGEQLIAWFEETAFADRIAPVYVAMKAYVRGEKALLDVNPETREPARMIFDRLAGAWHPYQETAHKTGQEKRRRGRPRKS